MMEATKIKYKEVNYASFVIAVSEEYKRFRKDNDKSEVDVAVCLNASHMTVRNCFAPQVQSVSDKVITQLMHCIGMEGKIEWRNGEKTYFIEK